MNLLTPRPLPSILCANVRSACHKLDEIRATLFARSIDVFICTETWFSDILDHNVTTVNGYECFREDRVGRVGGGVAIWIRSHIVATVVSCPHLSDFECLVIKFPNLKMIVMALYLPPSIVNRLSSAIDGFIVASVDEQLLKNPQYDVVIAGDLNRFDVANVCCSLNLKNISNRPTYSNAELDYVLFSESLAVHYDITLCAPFDRSKVPHLSLLASPQMKSDKRTHNIVRRVYDLRSSFVERYVRRIDSVDWSFLDDNQSTVNEKCFLFQQSIDNIVEECIPVSYVRFSASDKPWITPVVKDLINRRWQAYRRGDLGSYNHLKIKVRDEIQKAKVLWTSKMQEKDVWKTVNTHLGRNASSPIMSLLSQHDSMLVALNEMNSHLSTVCTTSDWTSIDSILESLPHDDKEWKIDISPCNVHRLLQNLPKHKSSPDVPHILYRSAASRLAVPVSMLLRCSFDDADVPESWKRAVITPIPKKRNPSFEDIRPISLLSPLSKIMERIVLGSIKHTLLANYDTHQFGFRPKSSTLCALVSLHDHITATLEESSTFGALVISYDYSKAFDRLRFDLIVRRLVSCGFPPQLIRWVSSYLRNRTQVVRIGETESSIERVTSGVPQGSVLGPFLFSFATATFQPASAHCRVLRYADDTTLILPLFKYSSNNHVMDEHRHLLEWSASNGLEMNINKSQAITIRKPNISQSLVSPPLPDVQFVNQMRILGVIFNDRLTWTSHVDFVIKKCSRLLFAFRTIRTIVPPAKLKVLYSSLVRSVIEYCAPLFLGLSSFDAKRLEILQRRFHRLICFPDCEGDCIPTLTERRDDLALKFLQNIVNDDQHILHNWLPPRSRHERFLLPPRKTERRSKTFFLIACERYNLNVRRQEPLD